MAARRTPTVAVLGAGAGGIAVGARLRRAGVRSFTIYEASDGVGGTWRHNVYPGAACDVMSHLYSFSFAPNRTWSRTFAGQPEILAYLDKVVDDEGLRPHLELRARVVGASWSDRESRWTLTFEDGRSPEVVDVVVSALGLFAQPSMPDIAGLDLFRGPVVHTSRWDAEVDLDGASVAVIGTGASSVQVTPQLARRARAVTVFQRTPAWMLPKLDRPYDDRELRRFRRIPGAARAHRYGIWKALHENTAVRLDDPRVAEREQMARAYLEHKVADPGLREALTPDYPFGCKRVLLGGTYYATLQQPNVSLVTSRISHVVPTGLVTADGREHPADVIVCATGFETTRYLQGLGVTGRDGRSLRDEWAGGAEAFLGLAVSGYPNLFLLYGPNTNQGGNSIIGILEAGARYVVSAVRALTRDPRPLDVLDTVQRSYNAQLQADLGGTIWTGCDSYFKTADGRIVTQWPYDGLTYARRTRRLRADDYARLPEPAAAG